jgi:hypothetical protein
VTTCVVEWNTAGGREPEPRKQRGRSKALQVFDDVLTLALADRGEDQGGRRVVRKEWVQKAFAQAWPKKGAHRPRWADAIRAAEDLRELEVLEVGGVPFLARPEAPF